MHQRNRNCPSSTNDKGMFVTAKISSASKATPEPVHSTASCKENPLMPSISDSTSAPDASSAFRCVFRLQTCLPHRLPPWSCLPPAFSASPGCRDFHCHPATFRNVSPSPLSMPLGIRCTAMSSAVLLHVPATPLAFRRTLLLHHYVSHHSAMPSGCSALLTRCTMSYDVA